MINFKISAPFADDLISFSFCKFSWTKKYELCGITYSPGKLSVLGIGPRHMTILEKSLRCFDGLIGDDEELVKYIDEVVKNFSEKIGMYGIETGWVDEED